MESQLKKILYIDDDEDLLNVVKLSLEEMGGYSVEICPSGDEGIRVAEEWRPDLIMLDVMMPDMDGPATLKCLKKNLHVGRTPVFFMTARGKETHAEAYLAMGAAGTIAKPFDLFGLSGEVNAMWRRLSS